VSDEIRNSRREVGWVQDLDVAGLRAAFAAPPFRLIVEEPYKSPGPFHDQRIFLFERDVDPPRD
jgi:hypothetical protein